MKISGITRQTGQPPTAGYANRTIRITEKGRKFLAERYVYVPVSWFRRVNGRCVLDPTAGRKSSPPAARR